MNKQERETAVREQRIKELVDWQDRFDALYVRIVELQDRFFEASVYSNVIYSERLKP